MKGKLPSIVMVFVALALVFSLAAVAVPNTVNANPDELEWTEITIPEQDEDGDYALWTNSNVGPIAVSPDGDTIFAASNTTLNTLMRSTDGGYSWKQVMTKHDTTANAWFPNPIVDIVVSPSWEDDDIVVVATNTSVYISDDRGVEFSDMTGALGAEITSLDAAIDEDGHLAMLAGNNTGVYLKTWVGGWVLQEDDAVVGNVLDAAFSPTYASDGQIVAVINSSGNTTVQGKFYEEDWAATVANARILDKYGEPNESVRASIGFPDDYDALTGPLFVGIQSTTNTSGADVTNLIGDAWRIDWSSTASVATDLNVRDSGSFEDTETDIYSIAVSGDAAEATILVGTEVAIATVPAQHLVHWSTDGGTTWLPSVTATDTKQPTGVDKPFVVMASPIAYAGTSGSESGFSASTSDPVALSWNQRGLIDTNIGTINDIAPSPTYATDETLFMVTEKASAPMSLWRTTDEGTTWERILTSTPLTACDFTMVELCEGGIFVANASKIYRSSDAVGTLFVKKITPREAINARAWDVVDTTTIYTGQSDGTVWKTTNAGLKWDKPDESDITGGVTSIVVGPEGAILVGDDDGKVYICEDVTVAYEFERVGPTAGPCTTDTYVDFDVDYAVNDMVYAGCANSDIYRFIIDESTVWDRITKDTDAEGKSVTVLVAADDGALYGLNASYPVRTVNPTEEDVDDINFELMDADLELDITSLDLLEVVPGSNILFTANATELRMFEDTLTGKVSLSAPADGITSGDILEERGLARVVLSWTELEGAKWYQYEVSLTEDMESVITTATGYVEGVVKDVELWLGTTYYWRARVAKALNVTVTTPVGAPLLSQWSETWSFTTPLGPGAARPSLESPEAGEQDMGLVPVLEWSGVVDAVNYELMVARDCDWTDLVVDKTGENALGAVTTYAVPTGVLAYDTDYCWKVKALSETTESPWSDEGSFRTMTEAAAAEAVPTPAWVWVVIAIGAILVIALIVLISRTRRPV